MKQQASFLFSIEAREDLNKIFDYTIYNYGKNKANGYNIAIMAAIEHICENPSGGRTRTYTENDFEIRYLRAARHYIFYVLHSGKVNIVRILHGSMDFRKHLP
jgi:plasmid stabilization system protein ParE